MRMENGNGVNFPIRGEEPNMPIRMRSRNEDDPFDCSMIMLDNPPNWNSPNKTEEQRKELSRRGKLRVKAQQGFFWQKFDYTIRAIRKALDQTEKWAVSFGGGKDSHVLSHIITVKMGLNIPHVMSNTRHEYPEIIRNAKRWKKFLTELPLPVKFDFVLPDMKPNEVWEKEGVPIWSKEIASKYVKYFTTGNENGFRRVPKYLHEQFRKLRAAGIKVTDKCCDHLKKQPMKKYDKEWGIEGHFTGIRCEESKARELMFLQRGALYFGVGARQWLCHPLVFWTEKDIRFYLNRNGIQVDEPENGTGRSGCTICAFGCHIASRRGNKNSLQLLAQESPKIHKKALDDWGYRPALEAAGIPYK